jgi:hypothetical protein
LAGKEFESSFVIFRPKGKKIGLKTTTPNQKLQLIRLIKLEISRSMCNVTHQRTPVSWLHDLHASVPPPSTGTLDSICVAIYTEWAVQHAAQTQEAPMPFDEWLEQFGLYLDD